MVHASEFTSWKGFEMTKLYRNEEYELRIQYSDGSWDVFNPHYCKWEFFSNKDAKYFKWLADEKHYTFISNI